MPTMANESFGYFDYEGLYYNVISTTEKTACVSYSRGSSYSGDIIIPNTVYNYNDNEMYTVTEIEDRAFAQSLITSIGFGDNIQKINCFSFAYCNNLTSVKIPDSVTLIGEQAFYGCCNLKYIEIGKNVSSIGNEAFFDCSPTKDVIYNSICCTTEVVDFGSINEFTIGSDVENINSILGDIKVLNYNAIMCTNVGDYSIFSSIEEINISEDVQFIPHIEIDCFPKLKRLNYNAIECSTPSDGGLCYYYDNKDFVVDVTIDENVVNIPYQAIGLRCNLYFNALNCVSAGSIGNGSAFRHIENIKWGDGVKNIPAYFFKYCSVKDASVLSIPLQIEQIGEYAYQNVNELSTITIPENVQSIQESAFNNCNNLKWVNLNCKNCWFDSGNYPSLKYPFGSTVEYLTIGSEVERISGNLGMSGLKSIVVKSKVPPTCGKEVFTKTDKTTKLYVPHDSYAAYWSSIGWQDFTNIIELEVIADEVLLPQSVDVALNTTYKLTPVFTPQNTTLKQLYWESSDPYIATVDQEGNVTALKNGKVTITATTIDGSNLSVSCIVMIGIKEVISIELSSSEIILEKNKTKNITCTTLPEDATDRTYTWKSENSDIAVVRVNDNGSATILGVNIGQTRILATTNDGSNLTAYCNVSVIELVQSISIDKNEINLKTNETAKLEVTILPESATNKSVAWTSSNEAVATVDANGVVTAIALGEAVITATTTDGTNLSATCKVTVVPTLAETITLDKTEISLEATENATLVATVLPELTTNKSVIWTSSNEAVATVDANGVVTAIAVGEAVITATTTDGSNLSASCKVTVVPTLAETITLDKTEISLEATETATLIVTVLPELTTDKSVEWSSSNESVATIDANGLVTAIAVGEAIITATTTDGSDLSASCKVTVVPTLAETIALDKTEISLEATETATLVATVLPETATNKSVTWASSNEAVATIDDNGEVTAIALGEAIITATTTDGSNLSASCKVTVVPTLAETITLDKTEISLEATETATLVATVLPELTTNKSVAWTSSNEAVATVDANGVVTAIALGEAVITATTTDGTNLSATCKVTVVPTLAETITLDKTEISLEATETVTLVATVLPELTTNKSVTWTSSNEAVATVDANGVVTAIALGESVITATTTDGTNLSATCKVTVIPTLAVSIELDQTEASVEEKSDLQLTATILPEHTTNKEVAWSSSDKWVATVDNTGLVTIHSAGEVIITATTTDGTNLSATCRINVYSGIDCVNGNDVIVATIGDNIVVKNAKLGSNVRVYAADGSIITSEIATDSDVVVEAPAKGIYVVAIDGKSFKVMVK